MARGNNNKKEESKAASNFKEFDITASHNNDFKGRVYQEKHEAKSGKGCYYGLTLTVNGVSIRGCKLWVPADENKDCSIMFPTFKDKNDKDVSYISFFEKDDAADVTEAANKIAELV